MERVDVGELKAGLDEYLDRIASGRECNAAAELRQLNRLLEGTGLRISRLPAGRSQGLFSGVTPVPPLGPVDSLTLLSHDRGER